MTEDYKSRDDIELVRLIAQGDRHAFEFLYDREVSSVQKMAYVHLHDHALAEDIVQETFIRLWKNAYKWRPEAKIKTWLLTVARNRCIDYLRKRKSDQKKSEGLLRDEILNMYSVEKDSLDKGLGQQDLGKLVYSAIFLLPERQKEAISLVYYMECSGVEAADVMGLTVSALESLLARARRNLREGLTERRTELMEMVNDKQK